MIIIFRVSPLLAPGIAIPFFFLTLFLTVATTSSLLFYAAWGSVSVEGMDAGRKLTISLREGVLLSFATIFLVLFQLLGLATWWTVVLIYAVFLFVELALHS